MKFSSLALLLVLLSCSVQKVSAPSGSLFERFVGSSSVVKDLRDSFGRGLCYRVIEHTTEIILPKYYSLAEVFKKKERIEHCDNPTLVFFTFYDANTLYIQAFRSDGNIHEYTEYPLVGQSVTVYYKVTLDDKGDLEIFKYEIIQG